jgi:DNA-binding SARP family transcriptional activator
MEGTLEFCVLGPLQVRQDETVGVIAGRRERTLLAGLILTVGEPVEIEQLAALLWPARRPRDVPHAIRTHVMRLRRHVGKEMVETSPGAYSLQAARDRVDAHRFDQAVSTGSVKLGARDLPAAEEALARALEIWHGGAPYVDLAGTPVGEAERARLIEERLEVEERLAAVRMCLHRSPLFDIEKLAVQTPLRENRWLLLMHALSTSGQQARALRSYAKLQARLRQELGLDPDRRLRDMERRILQQDPTLVEVDPLSLVLT